MAYSIGDMLHDLNRTEVKVTVTTRLYATINNTKVRLHTQFEFFCRIIYYQEICSGHHYSRTDA